MTFFTQISSQSIPVGVDLIQTSGYDQLGYGAATYSVGPQGSVVPLTRYSTNTANGRPVTLISDPLTIDMFGAKPLADHNSHPDIQAAIDYLEARGGGEVSVPSHGSYRIDQPLTMKNLVTLRGESTIQGSAGKIVCQGSAFLSFGTLTGFDSVTFSLYNIDASAGTPGVTNFLDRPTGGAWNYSTIEGCRFSNFNNVTLVLTGSRFINNNFEQPRTVVCQGSDALFIGNFSQRFDSAGADTAGSFWKFESATAMDFSHNYLTSYRAQGGEPAVLELSAVNNSRFIGNQFDGGAQNVLRVTNGTYQSVIRDNRLNSDLSRQAAGYVPLLLSNSTDVVVTNNWVVNIGPDKPWVTFSSTNERNVLRDNILNTRNEESLHDYEVDTIAPGTLVSMTGFGIPQIASLSDGKRFFSPHFTRVWTNSGSMNPSFNYFDNQAVKKGITIDCYRSDTSRRWIIYDEVANTAVYDSDTTPAKFFQLFADADGRLILKQ